MKISIITISFNSRSTILKTIESVNNQSYSDIEHVFIDGGSNDGTLDIINKHSKRDAILISGPDDGIYDAMNKGIKIANGDLICFLNSDDYFIDNTSVEIAINLLIKSNADLLISNVQHVNLFGKNIRLYRSSGFKKWMFKFGFMPSCPGSFFSKNLISRLGNFDKTFKIAGDFEYFIRCYKLISYENIIEHDQITVCQLEGGISTSGIKSNILITQEMKRALKKNNLFSSTLLLIIRLPIKYFLKTIRK